MKLQTKPITALITGSVLMMGAVVPSVHAQLALSGTSILADVLGDRSAPEALTVDWTVTQAAAGQPYLYTYIVNNPPGDHILFGPTAGAPEIVDEFTIDFDTTVAGAILGPITGGTLGLADDDGITWYLRTPFVGAGANSGPLSFSSLLPPSNGDASATDANPPSPWSVAPSGDPIPVPGRGGYNAPDATSTMGLLGAMMLLMPFRSMIGKRKE